MFNLTVFILALCILTKEAAVIKKSVIGADAMESTTTPTTTEKTLINDHDVAITMTESVGAVSREAEITLLDLEPLELRKTETQIIALKKSAKLLLLSSPKIAEKPKQPEENLEESEEETEMHENVTQSVLRTTTADSINEDTTATFNGDDKLTTKKYLDKNDQTDSKDISKIKSEIKCNEKKSETDSLIILPYTEGIKKLHPINYTLYANNNMVKSETINLVTIPEKTLNVNLGFIVLEESEADSILLKSENLQGSYTDVDSELYLQPIVQSVEIVPSSLDDTLLINYV